MLSDTIHTIVDHVAMLVARVETKLYVDAGNRNNVQESTIDYNYRAL